MYETPKRKLGSFVQRNSFKFSAQTDYKEVRASCKLQRKEIMYRV